MESMDIIKECLENAINEADLLCSDLWILRDKLANHDRTSRSGVLKIIEVEHAYSNAQKARKTLEGLK